LRHDEAILQEDLVNLTRVAIAVILVGGSIPVAAEISQPDLSALTRGAKRVVVATVIDVDPVFQSNEFGDQLIVSRTHLRVDEVLKPGQTGESQTVVMEVEGGTIGDLTLTVSDLPVLARGERAVIFLQENSRGAVVPHERGHGILELDASDHVKGTGLALAAVRRAVAAAR
jgi:hypothetical protein